MELKHHFNEEMGPMYVQPALEASAGGRNQVFVYGTLKNGYPNHHVLGPSRILKGHARASGFIMVDLGAFPGAVKVPNGGWHIFGEVYDIDDEHFKQVDKLEGHPRFYTRGVIDLDRYGKAWIYALPKHQYLQNGCRFIPGGRWSPECQAYVFTEDRINAPGGYDSTRPLIPAHNHNRPLILSPPSKVEKEPVIVAETCQVGPGYEEA